MGSMTEALRHLVRSVGGQEARETAGTVVEEKQKPREDRRNMTLDEARKRADEIVGDQYDSEEAHIKQDRLYVDVLRAVADGHPDAQAMAAECLRVEESDWPRWYA